MVAPDMAPAALLERLTIANDRMAHRGPDDAHVYLGEGVGLAARRLSIIDLAGGRQPLGNEDGSVWIAYNGEIFNAPALRVQLEQAGHRFATQTDTEVVVHAYEEWGTAVAERLRGMFAFAIWDATRRRLFVARDRFGIKPLFYAQHHGRFACASEILPVLTALPDLGRRVNHDAIWRLFELGSIPTPLTPFEGVWQLPAAHWLLVEDGGVTIRPYWQLTFAVEPAPRPFDTTLADFDELLCEAVRAWRMSDVPVGSLLSGGIDSSTLAALLTETGSGPIHTFNIAFDAASHDESARARLVAGRIDSAHHEIRFSTADFDLLPLVVRHLEMPQCSATSIPIYKLYQACRAQGLKVIMTGEGADELLGGYHWFDGDRRVRPWLPLPRALRQPLARLPLPVSADGRRVLARGTADPFSRYALWHEVSTPEVRRRLLPDFEALPPMADVWRAQFGATLAAADPLNQFLFLDANTRMVDFINFEVDRMSMANSVEARPPFLDSELWAYCATLPPDFKLVPGWNKRLLRQSQAQRLPTAVVSQPKQGLAAPHAAWWRSPRLPDWAEAALTPDALSTGGLFAPDEVARLRAVHQSATADTSRLLMGILTTQLWRDHFLTAGIVKS